ncbi:MAG: SAM-dependent methyltransferase [Lasallia pustulata]|uniref:SAM-dependent methyltransferase n=1 Tax=Lasallia pustulata TaxID=136370 RepID=A0A5M8PXA0_9LECA|nr:MAG: SAM-dependent methyltransferase [Lasallia pustulata]
MPQQQLIQSIPSSAPYAEKYSLFFHISFFYSVYLFFLVSLASEVQLRRVKPMAYNPAADFYDDPGMRYGEAFGHDAGFHSSIRRTLEMLPPNAAVLDIGSGTGKPTSSIVATNGRRVHGINFSLVMIGLS